MTKADKLDEILYSDEAVDKKRRIVMDLIGAILDSPRKESMAELWKLHIDAALDKLDLEIYEPAITKAETEARIDGFKAGQEDIINHYHHDATIRRAVQAATLKATSQLKDTLGSSNGG